MSKATPTTDDSRNARPTDTCSTAITVNNKYDRNMPATHRHVAREIVTALEETYDHNGTINATVVPTARGFNLEVPAGTVVGLATAQHVSPTTWGFDVLVYSSGDIQLQIRTDD